jgi:hypothetical protein
MFTAFAFLIEELVKVALLYILANAIFHVPLTVWQAAVLQVLVFVFSFPVSWATSKTIESSKKLEG